MTNYIHVEPLLRPENLRIRLNLKTIPIQTLEPHRDKTNKMACASSEDSDQPRHPPSLISVFAVCLKKAMLNLNIHTSYFSHV